MGVKVVVAMEQGYALTAIAMAPRRSALLVNCRKYLKNL